MTTGRPDGTLRETVRSLHGRPGSRVSARKTPDGKIIGDVRSVVINRRKMLSLLGLSGCAWLTRRASAQVSSACVVRPQQTEGPYFVDERLNRSDIRSDPASGAVKPGAPLQVVFRVLQLSGGACRPLSGAQVDVWHCDALGAYSDVRDPGGNTLGQKFLRGFQVTDASGVVRFTTIYPGWYEGRAVHIHFKIRTDAGAGRGREFTSQLYFDDALTDRVHAQAPYASRGQQRMRNDRDGIFQRGGRELILAVAESGPGHAGTFDIALAG
jgi:protocatechuate 3,4-dioxygenase beta subunit